ncbi:MAG: putative Na+/H+ antiporter, partial [Deltaproteobacteria bacterium]
MIGTLFFGVAVLHTFAVKRFQSLAAKFPEGSVKENLFHLLGEIEVVFGFWAGVWFLYSCFTTSYSETLHYIESLNFNEPLFVFVIMTVAATRPVIFAARKLIFFLSGLIPVHSKISRYLMTLILGPLLGSFITEPAAMTVTALILLNEFYNQNVSEKFKYFTVGVLFVNVSIGGVLTHYAAPPVLMVAGKWGWDSAFMMTHFGWKAIIAVVGNALLGTLLFAKELKSQQMTSKENARVPFWLIVIHLLFLVGIVLSAHHPVMFLAMFLFFLGIADISKEYQDPIQLKSSLLVAFFLAGLVVFGQMQTWWLQ